MTAPDASAPVPPRGNSRTRRAWLVVRAMLREPAGWFGLSLVAAHLLLAIFAPLLVPYNATAMDAGAILGEPSMAHPLGTDHLGRDILTRTMLGGREALIVTGIGTPAALIWGGLLGIFTGLVGGRFDEVLMRVVDAFLSLPWILKLLVLVVTFGTTNAVLIPTLAFFFGIPVIRVARAATHEVVARDFIQAARARGHGRASIMMRELLPNVTGPLMVEGAMRWSWMLLAFSSLSFLGFGATPPTPDWGLMISDGRLYMTVALWGVLGPMVALASLIIGINLVADALAIVMRVDHSRRDEI